jgi:hypothetical protein
MRLAEERGQVGGERVDEQLPLLPVLALFEPVEVSGELGHLQLAQTSREPAVHHLALLLAQGDAGAAMDERADSGEVAVGK